MIGALVVTICAAASTGPALEEITKPFAKQVVVTTGSSSAIAQQIKHGAPCDLVLLADRQWMDFLFARRLIQSNSRVNLLKNRLVIVRPNGQIAARRRIIADPDHVPLGRYTKAALTATNRWREWSKDLLLAPDARVALLWTEQGQAKEAILYASDARSSTKLDIIEIIDEKRHAPIEYPLAKCRRKDAKKVDKVYQILRGHNAKQIFAKHGFET